MERLAKLVQLDQREILELMDRVDSLGQLVHRVFVGQTDILEILELQAAPELREDLESQASLE